jgi:hypothetical protein
MGSVSSERWPLGLRIFVSVVGLFWVAMASFLVGAWLAFRDMPSNVYFSPPCHRRLFTLPIVKMCR